MNIFVLDEDPILSARYHCDKHICKMILESAQMLSSTYHILDSCKIPTIESQYGKFYKKTHINHPCTKWVREGMGNFQWLLALSLELCKEYTRRYDKEHKTENYLKIINQNKPNLPDVCSKFVLAMPDVYKTENVVESYREYYRKEKNNFATWKNNIPYWWKNGH